MSNREYVEQQLRKCGRHVVLYDKYNIKVCRITAT